MIENDGREADAATSAGATLWALAHGIAVLALERQLLFDVGTDQLIERARAAMATQLDAAQPPARADLRGPRRKALGKRSSDAL